MHVTILGAGVIAAALARAWSTTGHVVTLGVRDTSRAGVTHGITVQPLPQAIGSGQVTVMAIPADAVREVCERHAAQLAGRVVIDPTITFTPGGSPVMNQLAVLRRTGARYVRAFSTQGPEVLADPVIGGQAASQFYTADDNESQELAARLITDVGLRPVYVGDSDRVNVVDGVTRLWWALAIKQQHGRHLSFSLLTD
jgi:8-hydroxy-5-deazaflavin:NADPH oxidoreductase